MKQVFESHSQSVDNALFKLGFLINPLAGLGGTVALKGSDGVASLALERGARPKAEARARLALQKLLPWRDRLQLITAGGEMGGALACELGFACVERYHADEKATTAEDTRQAAVALRDAGVDLLVFAGGDGTARDIASVIGMAVPVLGIPAGVKMHSGVFAVTPAAAAEIVQLMVQGQMVLVDTAEVRDIDEVALREGRLAARYFAEMRVPSEPRYLQQVKCNGREVEALVLEEIAADVIERLEPGVSYFFGPGTTTAAILSAMGLPSTLLGVDVVRDGHLLMVDADASALEACVQAGPCRLVLTATGGQGILLGRGNQQITPAVLSAIGREGLLVVATHEKLTALNGRPLLMDIPDPALAALFGGYIEVISGYHHHVLYRLAADAS